MFGQVQQTSVAADSSNSSSQQRRSHRGRGTSHPMSPTALKFVKFSTLVFLLCSVHCTAGRYTVRDARNKHKKISNCLSYGHSCWGGHGKRSDSTVNNPNVATSMLPENANAHNMLLIARLLRGVALPGSPTKTNRYDVLLGKTLLPFMGAGGEDIRHWNDEDDTGPWKGEMLGEQGGGTRSVEESVGDIGRGVDDSNNSDLMDNYLMESGNTGNQYLARLPLTPMEQLHFRYLLTKHLSKDN